MNKLTYIKIILFLFLFKLVIPIANAQTNSQDKACDSATFYKLIQKQIKYFDKRNKKKYFISNEVSISKEKRDSETLVCSSIKYIGNLTAKKGNFTTTTEVNKKTGYFISSPVFNKEKNLYTIKCRHTAGEFGRGTAIFYYKKKHNKIYFVKKHIISLS